MNVKNFSSFWRADYREVTRTLLAVPKPLMTDLANDLTVTQIAVLLTRYRFELKGYTPLEIIERWLRLYPIKWVRLAVVEALYQGRYKAISVEHILSIWLRRGRPMFHFSYEFERLIFRVLPQHNEPKLSPNAIATQESEKSELISPPQETAEKLIHVHQWQENNQLQSSFPPEEPPTENQGDRVLQQPDFADSQGSNRQISSDSEPFIPSAPLPSFQRNVKPLGSRGRTIHEFTPAIDDSDFYSKLKAVVEQESPENNL
jgi:hypothetical protein